MVKKTVTYTDYNGVERTEDFYFNFNKAELLEMEVSAVGGMSERIQRIIDSKDNHILIKEFKEIVLKAYGVKSEDGRRLIKNPELTEAFTQTEAYSQIFMELATDSDAAVAFMKGIIPQDMENKSSIPAPKNK